MPAREHPGAQPLGRVCAQAGDPRSREALKDALPFVPRAGHPAPYGRWPTLNLVIEALAIAGRVEDAAALHPVAEDMIGMGFAIMFGSEALPRTAAGIAAACARNWARAEEHHQTAIHQADTMPHRVCQPIARYWYAEMLRARGEPGDRSRAGALLGEALAMFESLSMPLYARQATEKLAALG